MNPLKKLTGQTAIYGLPTIVGRLLNYLLVPLYVYNFEAAEYGVVTEFFAYAGFFAVLLTYGMETAFFRFASQSDNPRNVFSTSMASLLTTSGLFILIGLLVSYPLAFRIGYPMNPEYVRWFVLILAFDAMAAIPLANIRLQNRPLRFAAIKIVNISVNIFLNLFFIVGCPWILRNGSPAAVSLVNSIYDPAVGVGYIFISNLIASLVTFLMVLPDIVRNRITWDGTLLKNMLAYAWPLLILGFAGIVNETFDRAILKHLLPAGDAMKQLGIYGANYKVSVLMTLFIQTYRYAAEPFFFEMAKKDDSRQIYSSLMHYFIIVCVFIFLAVMVYIDKVILMLDREYRVGVGVVPILLIANMFLGIFYNLSIWFKLTDKTRKGALVSIIGAVITIVLNIALIPVMGYFGSAWATLACYTAMMAISYLWGQKYFPVNYNLSSAFFYITSGLLLYGISIYLPRVTGIHYLITGTLVLLVFLTTVWIREKRDLRSIFTHS